MMEALCLALNLYFEARGEGPEGMLAVADVTVARTHDPRWPDSLCGVVFEPGQFSWTADPPPITDPASLALAWSLSLDVIEGRAPLLDLGATYYHEASAEPEWAPSFERLGQIGNHVFYRDRLDSGPVIN